ncbi:MAG: hypothetical protein QME55_04555 [Brevundimonas sp.]|uniref:hypothetical protein n=1 Tax=Brevundimonas sp. TaxID=1871086 RepID=UPI002607EC5C|nr:hypothetical protein [Brevundimonas sp.]MDI6623980.1 hypothetical protein [Brevundimonas sp.]MDQ7811957.1 hypothetical protein [Brevundimonas sp.]
MAGVRSLGRLAIALVVALGFCGAALAQDEPPGGNAQGGNELSDSHHEGDHLGPIGPYLSAAELRNWPQGSRRPVPERLVRERTAEILAEAGTPCEIVAAHNPGETRQRKQIYEIACREGPGYLVVATDAPAILNCLHLAATEAAQRAADASRPVTSLCLLDGNKDAAAALRPLATRIDPACVVDQAAWIGRVGEDQDRYEVGCEGRDGLWLQTPINRTEVTESFSCLDLAAMGEACQFTTPAEQAATVASWLPADGPACAADRARVVGVADGARFYELSCGAEPGLILKLTPEGRLDQAWPCARATGIAGGCRLARTES